MFNRNSLRDHLRASYEGQPFQIDTNGYGVRVECTNCHASITGTMTSSFLHEHRCPTETKTR